MDREEAERRLKRAQRDFVISLIGFALSLISVGLALSAKGYF